jgi:hypothetical protein
MSEEQNKMDLSCLKGYIRRAGLSLPVRDEANESEAMIMNYFRLGGEEENR